MAIQNTKLKNTLICFLFILAILVSTALSQTCSSSLCPSLEQCCSRDGTCGTGDDHCSGFLCAGGPCYARVEGHFDDYSVGGGPRGKIESVITPVLFNKIMNKVKSNCSAKGFYTYKAFINAFKSFEAYKGTVAKREIAAILAFFSAGSKGFCYKESIYIETYCSKSKKYPCEPGKKYYGRGLLQSVIWNEYYGTAGKDLRLPLLKNPDLVARSPEMAFKFAMWFWNRNVRPALRSGFGVITPRIDGRECTGSNLDGTKTARDLYKSFCKMLGVTPDIGNQFCD